MIIWVATNWTVWLPERIHSFENTPEARYVTTGCIQGKEWIDSTTKIAMKSVVFVTVYYLIQPVCTWYPWKKKKKRINAWQKISLMFPNPNWHAANSNSWRVFAHASTIPQTKTYTLLPYASSDYKIFVKSN